MCLAQYDLTLLRQNHGYNMKGEMKSALRIDSQIKTTSISLTLIIQTSSDLTRLSPVFSRHLVNQTQIKPPQSVMTTFAALTPALFVSRPL